MLGLAIAVTDDVIGLQDVTCRISVRRILQEWDHTNFLVDLSGFYANCKALDRPAGVINVDITTPDWQSVVAVVGTIEGRETDAGSTTGYIEELIKRWMATNSYDFHVCRH